MCITGRIETKVCIHHSQSSSLVQSRNNIYNVLNILKDRNIRLNCLFVTSVLPLIEKSNVMLQKEEAFVHKLYSVLRGLMKDLLVRFIKPDAICCQRYLACKVP